MSKFCGNCGAKLSDDDIFCGNCGSKSETVPQTVTEQAAPEQRSDKPASAGGIKKLDKKKTILLISGIAVIAVAAIIGFILLITAIFGGSGAERALNNYASSIQKPTDENIERLVPKEYWEYMVRGEYSGYDDVDDAIEKFFDMRETLLEDYEEEYGDNIRVSYKIKTERDVTDSVLENVKIRMNREYDILRKDIKKMVRLKVLLTISGDEDELEYSSTMYAVLIRNDWYLTDESGYFKGIYGPEINNSDN